MYDDEESEWDKMYEKMRNEKAWNYAIVIIFTIVHIFTISKVNYSIADSTKWDKIRQVP